MVEELKCLNELRGVLKIIKLKEVRDKEEAEKAKLFEKKNERIGANNEGALKGLQPHLDIRSLAIEGYIGENFPSWMSTLQLNNLMVLRLEDCSKSRQLPTLGCLPRNNILEMRGMGAVKCTRNEFYSRSGRAGVLFPALKELTLFCMDGLEEWMVPGREGDQVFPFLEKYSIWRYGMLKSIPICGLSSLVVFEIEDCDELRYLSGEFDGFKSLQLLRIWGCKRLTSNPSVQHCTALVELNINDFPEFIIIPGDFRELKYSLKKLIVSSLKLGALPSGLQCCASLEELSIMRCRELIHINGLQELSSLRRLWISSCDRFISIDWHELRQLRSLVELTISGCWSLSDFLKEDCLGNLTQLEELGISGFTEEMEAFPVGLVNSFQHLNLSGLKR